MLGSRDSECAAVVRDTDMLWSTMAGQPYRVGRFAHTLRLRLMREHLGLDVDEIIEEEREADLNRGAEFEDEMERIYSDGGGGDDAQSSTTTPTHATADAAESSKRNGSLSHAPDTTPRRPDLQEFKRPSNVNFNVDLADLTDTFENEGGAPSAKSKAAQRDPRVTDNEKHKQEVAGYGLDHWKSAERQGLDQGRDSLVVDGRELLVRGVSPEGRGTLDHPSKTESGSGLHSPSGATNGSSGSGGGGLVPQMPPFDRRTTEQLGLPRANQLPSLPVLDDTDIGGPPAYLDAGNRTSAALSNPLTMEYLPPLVHKDCMRDPVNPSFYDDIWARAAAVSYTHLTLPTKA